MAQDPPTLPDDSPGDDWRAETTNGRIRNHGQSKQTTCATKTTAAMDACAQHCRSPARSYPLEISNAIR